MTATETTGTDSTGEAGSDRLVVDLLDPELYRRDPHDVWSWMRTNEPVYRDHRNGLWGITRHADVMFVERTSSVFWSGQGYRALWSPEEVNMIAHDDHRHRQQRMLVQPKLTGKAVADRRSEIAALTAELVDALVSARADGAESVEVVDALSGQLPARTTARLLGYPEEMWPQVKSWSERLMRTDLRERSGEVFCEFMDANIEYATALGPVAAERTACPARTTSSAPGSTPASTAGVRRPPRPVGRDG